MGGAVDFNPTVSGNDSGRVRRLTESADGGFGILLRPTRVVEPSDVSVIDFLLGPQMGGAGILLQEALSIQLAAIGGLDKAEVLLGDSLLKSCELELLSREFVLSRLPAEQRLLSGDVVTSLLDKKMPLLLSHDTAKLDGLVEASLFLAGILFLFVL